jgi:large conductance mechanosensitive channel
MFKEFREFAMKGNVVDMAVGIIIGAAFGAIVNSLVKDILMPPFGFLLGNVDFSNLYIVLSETGKEGPVVIKYGTFINVIISFIIVAFALFILIKGMNKMRAKKEEAPATTKDCPYCFSKIPVKATRCPNCTSELG